MTTIDYSLYLVTDPQLGGSPEKVPGIVDKAIRGGVTVVQLRDKDANEAVFTERAREVKRICDAAGVPLILNDRLEIAIALGTHLHIGQGDIPYSEARRLLPDHLSIGLTIENPDQLAHAIAESGANGVRPPDLVGLGPVQGTPTKLDAPQPVGIDGVAAMATTARAHGIASVAIGGVGLHNAAELARTDIDGLCVVSAIMSSPDPTAAAAELASIWEKNQ